MCHQQYNEKKSFLRHLQKHSIELVVKVDPEGEIAIEPGVQYIVNDDNSAFISQPHIVSIEPESQGSQGAGAVEELLETHDAAAGVEYRVVYDDSLEAQYVDAAVASAITTS